MAKGPGGRPTKYRPEYCEKAIEMLKGGAALIEVACELGVLRETLWCWAEKNPEFSAALNLGLQYSEVWWTREGQMALRDKDFNSRLFEINVMNRFGWMRKTDARKQVKMTVTETENDIRNAKEAYKKDE
jgi:transposase